MGIEIKLKLSGLRTAKVDGFGSGGVLSRRRPRLLSLFLLTAMLLCLILVGGDLTAQSGTVATTMECNALPYYKHRPDGKAGRAVMLQFKGGKLYGAATIRVSCNGVTEQMKADFPAGTDSLLVLLPAGAGVQNVCQAQISVSSSGGRVLQQSIIVPPKRQWTVYIYPHSHVDIGYTETQDFVRRLHMKNIDVAIRLARRTQNYPQGARFVWNPEALWVVESYLASATAQKKKDFIEAVKKGWICLDGSFGNVNTSACSDEELLRLFHASNEIQKITGVPIHTMVQMDVPGASWGITQAAYQNGIRGFFSFPNHVGRIGTIREAWEHKPFYWVAPDGKSKILFYQAYPYGYGYVLKGSKLNLAEIQGRVPGIDSISTKDPTANFIDPFIFDETAKLEAKNSPYDMYVMTWSLADNTLVDTDLPDAVRLWNEKYAFPKLIIAGAGRIMHDFESKYSGIVPEVKGDYTEYWTDGLGADARRVGMNRRATENMVQMETVWSMLNVNKPRPKAQIDSAWRYCLLGVEHTWGYYDPAAPKAKQIEDTKAGYFENSLKSSKDLLKETLAPVSRPNSHKIALLNTLSWARGGLITLTKEQSIGRDRVVDEQGGAVPSQRLSTGELVFYADNVPALGSAVYTLEKAPVSGGGNKTMGSIGDCQVTGTNTLSNGILSMQIDPKTGSIISLYDQQTRHEYADKNSKYGLNDYRYLLGADAPEWALTPYNVRLKIKENGPLVVSILVESDAQGCNWLNREIKLVKGQPQVYITNSFNKIKMLMKEGMHFGFAFNVPGGTTRMDIPWGVMIPEYDQLPGANRNWLTFQHWVDISNDSAGVSWTAIESPLIELGDMTANILGDALKTTWRKQIAPTQTLFSWALNNHWYTNFPLEQGGVIALHYRIFPHGPYDPVAASHFGLEANRPLLAVPVDQKPVTEVGFQLNNPKVYVTMLKQSEDGQGMILRLRSVSDQPEDIGLQWATGKSPKCLYECLADEQRGGRLKVGDHQKILPFGTVSYYFER